MAAVTVHSDFGAQEKKKKKENECFILDTMVSTLSVHPQISDKHATTKSSQ